MTWSSYLLADDDDLVISRQGACVTNGRAIIQWSGAGTKYPIDVAKQLAASDTTGLKLRIKNGRTVDEYNASSTTWVDTNPTQITHSGTTAPMRCRDVDIRRVEAGGNLFEVRYKCSVYGPIAGESGNPLSAPPVQVSTVARGRSVSMFRSDATVPTETEITGLSPTLWKNSGNDIGGRKVDINCRGIPSQVDQTVITISWPAFYTGYTWNTTEGHDEDNTDGTYTDLKSLGDWVGGRNSKEFLGYPVGSLYFESIDLQPMNEYEFRRVSISLVYDQWHHAHQAPLTIAGGSQPVTADADTAELQAATVLWHQPYFDAFYIESGNSPFPDYILTWLTDLYQVAP